LNITVIRKKHEFIYQECMVRPFISHNFMCNQGILLFPSLNYTFCIKVYIWDLHTYIYYNMPAFLFPYTSVKLWKMCLETISMISADFFLPSLFLNFIGIYFYTTYYIINYIIEIVIFCMCFSVMLWYAVLTTDLIVPVYTICSSLPTLNSLKTHMHVFC